MSEIGLSRQTLHVALRQAQIKMRALIAGTDDFPLLRSAWSSDRWEEAIRRDMAEEDVRRALVRRRSAERQARRRAALLTAQKRIRARLRAAGLVP